MERWSGNFVVEISTGVTKDFSSSGTYKFTFPSATITNFLSSTIISGGPEAGNPVVPHH